MKKIICKGGLGNQMFQYAFYSMCRLKQKSALDIGLFDFLEMHNGFELQNIFELNPKYDKIVHTNTILLRLCLKLKNHFPVCKDNLLFDESKLNSKCLFFNGTWQSEKWFLPIKNDILKYFTFKHIDKRNLLESILMQSCESVSLHIRRGDYIGNSVYDNCATLDYYEAAIKKMQDSIKDIRFWVFSNDIEWCKKNLSRYFNQTTTFVDWNTGVNSYQDMFLMTQCKYNIIANSSFSWWGAYLNKNPNKIVIAPSKWLNTSLENYKDIVPDSWIKI